MQVSSLRMAVIGGCCLVGCGPAPQPAAGPGASNGAVDSATVRENVPPDVAPPEQPMPSVENPVAIPIRPAPSTAPQDSLRDLASRLVEPNGEGGWRISEPAALELERLGPDAPAKLLPLMSDERLEVRRGAAFHLLASFDPAVPEQVAAYQKLLNDNDATIRGLGLQAARQMSAADRDAVNGPLLAMLDSQAEPESKNRAAVARFAGSLAGKGASFAQALAKAAANDPDDRVRSAAIFALTQVAPPDAAIVTLRRGLVDNEAAVRLVAAGRLRSLAAKAEPAIAELGQALADEDERVRTAAAEALVLIGEKSVPALRTALESKDVNAKKLALACLSSLGPAAKDALPAIEKAQQDADKDVSEAAKVLAARLKP